MSLVVGYVSVLVIMLREMSSPPLKYPWQQFVLDAFMEVSPLLLAGKVHLAEQVIAQRLSEVPEAYNDEHLALRDASSKLRKLTSRKE
jgi:hypothetical protein